MMTGDPSRDRTPETTRSTRTNDLFHEAAAAPDEATRGQILDDIVLLNLSVADGVASRYIGRGVPADDLAQVARLALVRAVRGFRLEFDRDFLAYAVPCIRGEVRKHFRDHGWTIRPPRRVQEAQLQINRARPQLVQELGREPTVTEVADATELDEETIVEALSADRCFSPDSLDRSVDEPGGFSVASRLGADDPNYELCDLRLDLAPLLDRLPPRDQKVLRLRFVDQLTQREVGEQIGVTQMQVSRILTRVLSQLREQLAEEETEGAVPVAGAA